MLALLNTIPFEMDRNAGEAWLKGKKTGKTTCNGASSPAFPLALKILYIILALVFWQEPHTSSVRGDSGRVHHVSRCLSQLRPEKEHARMLVASGVTNVTDGNRFVAALMDPEVTLVLLTSPVIDVQPDAWKAIGANLPIVINRNLSVEGNEFDWPLLRLHYVRDVVQLVDNVTMFFRFVFLDGANGGNNYREQGFAFLAPTPSNQESELLLGPAAASFKFCLPLEFFQFALLTTLDRPSRYQDVAQLVLPGQGQAGCLNGSLVPPLHRCWSALAFAVDVGGYGSRIDPSSDKSVRSNTLFRMRNVTLMCEHSADSACLSRPQAEPLICLLEVIQQYQNDTSSFLDDYQPQLQQFAQQQQDHLPPPPSGAMEGMDGGRVPHAVVVGVVVAGTLAAVTGAVVAASVVWRRRSRRQRGHCSVVSSGEAMPTDWKASSSADAGPDLKSVSSPVARITDDADGSGEASRVPSLDPGRPNFPAANAAHACTATGSDQDQQAACSRPTIMALVARAVSDPVITPDTQILPNLQLCVRLVDSGDGDDSAPTRDGNPASVASPDAGPLLHGKGEDGASRAKEPNLTATQDGKSPEFPDGGHAAARSDMDSSGLNRCRGGRGGDGDAEVKLSGVVRGKGAFGRVVEGTYRGQRVAVKLLASNGPWGGPTEAFAASFAQEVQVLSRCQHPNVVRLLAACVDPPRLCLVLELMETSLDRLMYGNPAAPLMPLPKVLHIAISITSALAYLHPTIIHRDLKPANVLINDPHSDGPTVKLTDFGLSRLRVTVAPTENPDAGTPAYMAPECFDLMRKTVTHKADMFSLGVLLWEMLAGMKPWNGMHPLAIALHVACNGARPPLTVLNAERCPTKLGRLLQACWEKDPARRPAAAEAVKELVLILQQIQQVTGEAVISVQAGPPATAATTAAATAIAAGDQGSRGGSADEGSCFGRLCYTTGLRIPAISLPVDALASARCPSMRG